MTRLPVYRMALASSSASGWARQQAQAVGKEMRWAESCTVVHWALMGPLVLWWIVLGILALEFSHGRLVVLDSRLADVTVDPVTDLFASHGMDHLEHLVDVTVDLDGLGFPLRHRGSCA